MGKGMRSRFPVAVHVFVMRKGKVLLLRRCHTGYEDGNYSVVAGHLDGDETFVQAMVREAKEEANIAINPTDMEVVHVMHRKCCPGIERIDFFIRAKKWKGEPKNMETHKCDDLEWFEISNLPKNIIPYVKQAIECIGKRVFYSEHGW
jgi:ADP-ribose pyrophosphatase YjhB (NUDIX family)